MQRVHCTDPRWKVRAELRRFYSKSKKRSYVCFYSKSKKRNYVASTLEKQERNYVCLNSGQKERNYVASTLMDEKQYETVLRVWQVTYPLIGSLQWAIKWYGMGKTSTPSRFNMPGRLAWATMEAPGFMTLLYVMRRVAAQRGGAVPWQNQVLAGLFTLHYTYRALLFPLLQPSMAPIHPLVWAMALSFQLFNGTCLGGWLGGLGGGAEWGAAGTGTGVRFGAGVVVFCVGLAGNYVHDAELRGIRRRVMRGRGRGSGKRGDTVGEDEKRDDKMSNSGDESGEREGTMGDSGKKGDAMMSKDDKKGDDKTNERVKTQKDERHYEIPQAGLFRFMLYPHYLCEWIEWTGFLMAAGWHCRPAWAFLINEVASMLPRAVRGREWYVERFGAERIGDKWTIIPGLV